MHPFRLRCSSSAYPRYASSSRLAGRAPRRPRFDPVISPQALDEGLQVSLAECVGFNEISVPFTINIYRGKPDAPKQTCDFLAEKCSYTGIFAVGRGSMSVVHIAA